MPITHLNLNLGEWNVILLSKKDEAELRVRARSEESLKRVVYVVRIDSS